MKYALIGCGRIATSHIKAVLNNELELVAVCDVSEEHAQAVADVLENDVYVTTRWEDIVDKVDAVMVALPHDLHYECGVFFARHKKHLFMEKPLANSCPDRLPCGSRAVCRLHEGRHHR